MNKSVRLRKQGKFYCSYEEVAYVMYSIFNYKISNGKVGFPLEVLGKVTNTLDSNKVNYVVIENDNEITKKTFPKNNYSKYLSDGKKTFKVLKYEEELIDKIKELPMDKIEKIINYIKEVIHE